MKKLLRLFLLPVLLVTGASLRAAERIPPVPPRYFNDYAGIVSRAMADQLNARLEQFERESSNQLLVAIYPRMESNSSVEDYTVRVAQAWKAGQRGRNNGAVLFAFMQEHQLYLQVGYGLEAVLPDITAKRIIENEIVPRFRAGDMDGGMHAAVNAMIAAARGEYKGTGRTVADRHQPNTARGAVIFIVSALFVGLMLSLFLREGLRRPVVLGSPRRRTLLGNDTWWTGGGGSSWSGGSSWDGGGGGFSGGGGSFGGGGAGGKW